MYTCVVSGVDGWVKINIWKMRFKMWETHRNNQTLNQFDIPRFKHKIEIWIWNTWNFTVLSLQEKTQDWIEIWKLKNICCYFKPRLLNIKIFFADFFAISHPKSWHLENDRTLEFIKVKIKIERYKSNMKLKTSRKNWHVKNPKQDWELKCINNISMWFFRNRDWVGRWNIFEIIFQNVETNELKNWNFKVNPTFQV